MVISDDRRAAVLMRRLSGVSELTGDGMSFDPSSHKARSGNILVAEPSPRRVTEYSPSGSVKWQYNTSLVEPVFAQRFSDGNTLVADRGSYTVFEVDKNKNVKWKYGVDGTSGLGAGQLKGPAFATRVGKDNNILIADADGSRVILVRRSDKAITWRYGKDGDPGTGSGELVSPSYAQRLSNGNTLITDKGGHRVLEVDSSGDTVRQYGKSGVSGADSSHLRSPTSAQRQTDGSTVVSTAECEVAAHHIRRDVETIDVTKIGGGSAWDPRPRLARRRSSSLTRGTAGSSRAMHLRALQHRERTSNCGRSQEDHGDRGAQVGRAVLP
jgi:hypothetical protein